MTGAELTVLIVATSGKVYTGGMVPGPALEAVGRMIVIASLVGIVTTGMEVERTNVEVESTGGLMGPIGVPGTL